MMADNCSATKGPETRRVSTAVRVSIPPPEQAGARAEGAGAGALRGSPRRPRTAPGGAARSAAASSAPTRGPRVGGAPHLLTPGDPPSPRGAAQAWPRGPRARRSRCWRCPHSTSRYKEPDTGRGNTGPGSQGSRRPGRPQRQVSKSPAPNGVNRPGMSVASLYPAPPQGS